MSPRTLVLLLLTVLLSACVENTAPGNDREASLDPPAPAAEVASAGAALEGVATALLYPEIMTDADVRNAPRNGEACAFRFTRVGFPVFVYGASTGVIKLNGKLIPLPVRGDGVYEEGGIQVGVRPSAPRKRMGRSRPSSCSASRTPATSLASTESPRAEVRPTRSLAFRGGPDDESHLMDLLLPLVGAGLLLLLATDVFVTVFHPEGHGGPLTRRHNGAVWGVWRKAAPSGKRRDAWLGLGGPILAVLTPAVWALLLIGGFGLIYYPWMERFLVSPGTLRGHWAEALYYSGFAAATLGTGDIVPDLVSLRLLSIVQALSGFALLSAALSYILAIYRENGRKTTLASELALHYHIGGAGDEPLSVPHERELWLKHVARELLHVTQAHAQYPILHYFRPTDPRNSLALQLEPLVRMSRSRGSHGQAGGQPASSGAALVSESLERYLIAADRRFVRSPSAEAMDESLKHRYRRLLDYLGYTP